MQRYRLRLGKDQVNERARSYARANRAKVNKSKLAYYYRHREEIIQKNTEYKRQKRVERLAGIQED